MRAVLGGSMLILLKAIVLDGNIPLAQIDVSGVLPLSMGVFQAQRYRLAQLHQVR
jgi:hypothetical protein